MYCIGNICPILPKAIPKGKLLSSFNSSYIVSYYSSQFYNLIYLFYERYLVVYSVYHILFVIIEKNIILKFKKGGTNYELSTQFDSGTYKAVLTSNKKPVSEISLPHHEYISSKGEVLASHLRTSFNELLSNLKSKSN